jgi:hypothetical protein
MMTPDSIIMSRITEMAISDKGSVAGFTKMIIPKLPVIAFMVIVKKCLENSNEFFYTIWKGIKYIVKKTLYTEHILVTADDSKTKCYYYNKSYTKRKYSFFNQLFPIYMEYENDETIISYMNWYPKHKKIINDAEKEATKNFKDYELSVSQVKVLYKKLVVDESHIKYIDTTPSLLYSSQNYINLTGIIKSYASKSKKIKSYSVLGLLIDGVEGLGKTTFLDYAVTEKVVGSVYKVDMTTMLKYDFSLLLRFMYHKIDITTDTIFMFDELDKYLDYRLRIEYEDELKIVNNNNKKNKQSNTLDKEKFYETAKTNFLYDMLSILERSGLTYPVIVIFCSNNFNSIFDNIDMTHHKSLYSRFMKVKFTPCDHTEIVNYIIYYNDKFFDELDYVTIDKTTLSKLLRRDILITHRRLHHITIEAQYNPYTMIDLLNQEPNVVINVANIKKMIDNKKDVKNEEIKPEIKNDEDVQEIKPEIKNDEDVQEIKPEIKNDEDVQEIKNEIDIVDTSEVGDISGEDKSDKLNKPCEKGKDEDSETSEDEKDDKKLIENSEDSSEEDKKNDKKELIEKRKTSEEDKKYDKNNEDSETSEEKKNDKKELIKKNDNEKNELINKLNQDVSYKLVWQDKYETTTNPSNKNEIIVNIKEFLSQCENSKGEENKKFVVAELIDYLSLEGYKIMGLTFLGFKKAVYDKLIEFYLEHPDVYELLKPSSKEFVYAVTGITC